MKRSEIEKKFFDELVHDVDSGKITGTSERVAIISSGALVMAIDRLDKSSTSLEGEPRAYGCYASRRAAPGVPHTQRALINPSLRSASPCPARTGGRAQSQNRGTCGGREHFAVALYYPVKRRGGSMT
jgi:hypothetical protein